jgi:hypothetical protein
MHVRIACSQWDKLVGCRDYGPRRPWFGQDEAVVAEYVDGLMRRIDRGSPAERLAAAERLAYINSKKAYDALSSLLCERDSQLVESALSGMKRISADEVPETVLAKLACAPTPSVSVVLFERVMRLRDERVWEAARGILKRAAKEKGCEGEQCPAYAVLVADAATALGFSANLQDGELLVAFIESPEPEIARAAAAALRTLYATDTPVLEAPVSPDGKQEKKGKKDKKAAKGKKGKKQPSEAEQWRAYVAARKDLDWKTHVHASLVAAGLKPDDDLLSRKSIPALLKAVKLGGPLAYSAAVALSQILQSPMPWVLEPDEALGRFKKLAGDK